MATLVPETSEGASSTSSVPHPVFQLSYGKKNITHDITPYVLSVGYTDHVTGKSDELEVTLEDADGRWIKEWYPGKGDVLTLKIGYAGEPLLPCGRFVIDEIELAKPPSIVSLRALAAPVTKAIRTRKSAPYENTTLAAIAQRVAKRHQLTLIGKIENVKVGRVTQYQETDVAFLTRIGAEYGHAFKIVGDKLVFTQINDLQAGDAVTGLQGAQLIAVRLKDKIKSVYAGVSGKYQDGSNKKLVSYELKTDGSTAKKGQKGTTAASNAATESSADTLKISAKAGSKGELKTKSRAALDKANSQQVEGNLTVVGNTKLVAGNTVNLLNMGRFSGKYFIETARHRLERSSGYTTEITIKRSPAKQSTGKGTGGLKVYGVKKDGETGVVAHTAKKTEGGAK